MTLWPSTPKSTAVSRLADPIRRGIRPLCCLLLVGALSGCASETEEYCDSLADQKQVIADLAGEANKPQADLFDSLPVFRELRDDAPGDMADEWETFVFAWEGLADAFDAAGVSPDEYDPGDTSSGVSKEQSRAIEDAAQELRSTRVVDAVGEVEQHANDVCNVDLGL